MAPLAVSGLYRLEPLLDHLVDDAELPGLLSIHEIVAIERPLNGLPVLACMLLINIFETPLHLQDVFCVALDIGGLPLEAARRLVKHDPGVGQREAHPV